MCLAAIAIYLWSDDLSWRPGQRSVMTEITDKNRNCPPPSSASSCIGATWAAQWGVNRSVSQIHALLYLSERR